jgi:hypothetical protein
MKSTTGKFVAICISAPLLALGLTAPVAWAAPDGCSQPCTVGGSGGPGAINSDGKANGGHLVGPLGGTNSGTTAVGNASGYGAGHRVVFGGGGGSFSGNFTTVPGHGTCSGVYGGIC